MMTLLLVWFDRVSSLFYFLQYFLLCSFYFFLCILIYMYRVKKTDNMHSWLLTICPWPHGNKTWTHDIWRYIFLVPMNYRMFKKSSKEPIRTNWKWLFIYMYYTFGCFHFSKVLIPIGWVGQENHAQLHYSVFLAFSNLHVYIYFIHFLSKRKIVK